MKRLPDPAERHEAAKEIVNDAVLDHLCVTRYPEKSAPSQRKRVNVQPGKSVTSEDIPGTSLASALPKRVNKRKMIDEGDSDKENETEDEYTSEESAETDLDEDVNESSLETDPAETDQICESAVSESKEKESVKVVDWVSLRFTERKCYRGTVVKFYCVENGCDFSVKFLQTVVPT